MPEGLMTIKCAGDCDCTATISATELGKPWVKSLVLLDGLGPLELQQHWLVVIMAPDPPKIGSLAFCSIDCLAAWTLQIMSGGLASDVGGAHDERNN